MQKQEQNNGESKNLNGLGESKSFDDIMESSRKAGCKIREGISELGTQAREMIGVGETSVKDQIDKGVTKVAKQSKKSLLSMRQLVRTNPLRSIGVAVGLGLLFGLYSRSRNS